MFDGSAAGASLSGMFSNCSHGATSLSRASSRVAPLATLPCSGTSLFGNAYSSDGLCEFGDFAGGWGMEVKGNGGGGRRHACSRASSLSIRKPQSGKGMLVLPR